MTTNRLAWIILLLLTVAVQLPAQRSEVDRKLLADVLAKADKGDAQSQNALGMVFSTGGLGVAKDQVEAVNWFRKAAEQSYVEAQFALGDCYANGRGVAKNEVEAVKWYRKAADQNYVKAQYNLGVCYANGRGVAKDEVEAVKWYRKAADQNYVNAQYNLAQCYANGQGVAKDYVEAYKWCLLAKAQGDERANKSMTTVGRGMTQEQVAEGQKLARDFKPRVVPPTASDGSRPGIAPTRP